MSNTLGDRFMNWWAQVNMKLSEQGCSELLFGTANALFVEGITPDVAATREARFQKGDRIG